MSWLTDILILSNIFVKNELLLKVKYALDGYTTYHAKTLRLKLYVPGKHTTSSPHC